MQKLTSYDSLTSFGWVCAIVVVLVLRDIPLFDYESYNLVASCVLVAAVAGIVVLLYLQRKIKRRAEDKVRMSELILPTDIQILAKSNSQLLDDAIDLRCAQRGNGRSPGD